MSQKCWSRNFQVSLERNIYCQGKIFIKLQLKFAKDHLDLETSHLILLRTEITIAKGKTMIEKNKILRAIEIVIGNQTIYTNVNYIVNVRVYV